MPDAEKIEAAPRDPAAARACSRCGTTDWLTIVKMADGTGTCGRCWNGTLDAPVAHG